jgi:hypothetical protein
LVTAQEAIQQEVLLLDRSVEWLMGWAHPWLGAWKLGS